jgi:hypothetical protein
MTQLKYRILKWLNNFKKYSTENSIHARPLRHRPFKHFFDENDAHYGDLIWHTEACQLTKCGSVLSNWPTVVKVCRQQLAYSCQSLSAATGLQLSKSLGSNWPKVVKVSRQQLAYSCQSLSAATGLQLSKSVGSNWPTVVKVSRQQLAYSCQSLSAAPGLQWS